MLNNIYLIGMPGCGKSTLACLLSKKIKIEFLELDRIIEEREGRTIPDIFKDGEAVFRKAETDALRAIAETEGVVVSTGGGIVTIEENINIMKSTGKVVFIDASPEFILSNSSLEGRPLLADKNKIHDLYRNRIALYRKAADVTVQNDGILSDVCNKLESVIRKMR